VDDGRVAAPAARQKLSIALAICATLPGTAVGLLHPHLSHPLEAAAFGLAIVGAAFLLSWAAEVAQLDISAGLAIAILAFIAVLPEYAVDFVFASNAGNAVQRFGEACGPAGVPVDNRDCSLALANMTGANRLLIGIGWSLVVLISWYRARTLRRHDPSSPGVHAAAESANREKGAEVVLERSHSVELSYLTVATVYSLTLPLKHSITLIDAIVLVGIFVAYTLRISGAPSEQPHLIGPAAYVGQFAVVQRRTVVGAMALIAAAVILICAEPFAHALVQTGEAIGISSFVLVQWLAPLASEAPELLIAGMYAWRRNPTAGLGTLVSSKVNQWTLLVGSLPIVFAFASGTLHGLPIASLQRQELFLTAAQSLFAVALLLSLSLSVREAIALLVLFWAQFVLGAVVPESLHALERIGVGCLYIVLGLVVLVRNRSSVGPLLRDGFRTPYEEMAAQHGPDEEPPATRAS
jgi:cation:H+ antiporter